jgi:hypothetical protein
MMKETFEARVLRSLERIEKRLGRVELRTAVLAAVVSIILRLVL